MKYNIGYFGDKRLEKNGEIFAKRMIEKQTICLRQLGENRAGEVKFGRWLSNKKVMPKELIKTITQKTNQLVSKRHVLAIQDTTELNYQAHNKRVKDIGTVGNGTDLGIFLHPMLVLDAEEKTCLGLGAITHWVRTKKAEKRHRLPIEKKESYRWIETADQTKKNLKTAAMVTIIADRESDIYEEWDRIPDAKTQLLTRACRNRKLKNGENLFTAVNKLNISGLYSFKVDERVGKRSAHLAKLEIRFGEVEIKKSGGVDKLAKPSILLRVVDVKEISETVIKGEKPIHWCLLTTHNIKSQEDALQIVKWYCLRWNIEQLFRTLKKQGLDIESSQVESGEGLRKLAILALYVAMQTMQLMLSRKGKEQIISVIFNNKECEMLLKLQKKLEGKTQKQKNPHPLEKLSWGAWIIARLGGWKGYRSESLPGPITMLRGLKQFQMLFEGYQMANMCA